jgi:hypothetical protein
MRVSLEAGSISETQARPSFSLIVNIDSTEAVEQTLTISIDLPSGLRWGSDGPDPTEGCTATAPWVCHQKTSMNPAGTWGAGYQWRVVADQPGPYAVTASVTGEQPDPDTSNNTATLRFEVVASGSGGSGGGGSGGGGGNSAAVTAGAVKLSPTSPKAGSTVVASVRVARGGSPVRPSGVACSATVGKTKVKGGPKSSSGVASCLFKTPGGAKGQTLAGSVSFAAGGQRFTKRFSTKLR